MSQLLFYIFMMNADMKQIDSKSLKSLAHTSREARVLVNAEIKRRIELNRCRRKEVLKRLSQLCKVMCNPRSEMHMRVFLKPSAKNSGVMVSIKFATIDGYVQIFTPTSFIQFSIPSTAELVTSLVQDKYDWAAIASAIQCGARVSFDENFKGTAADQNTVLNTIKK